MVADGCGNKQTEATGKTHLIRLYAKLGAADRASAVSLAYRQGLPFTGDD